MHEVGASDFLVETLTEGIATMSIPHDFSHKKISKSLKEEITEGKRYILRSEVLYWLILSVYEKK